MKISTRLNLFSLATILVMTAAVFGAAVLFLQGDLRQSRERLMQLELNGAAQAIRQQLGRSGVVAASREAAEQLRQLRGKEGFASASLFVVEKNDSRIVYHPNAKMGERVTYAFVEEMLRRQTGSLEYDYKGDERMAVFQTMEPIDWLVGVAVSRQEVYAPMFGLLRAIGGITFAALCLSGIAVSLYGRWLMRRIGVCWTASSRSSRVTCPLALRTSDPTTRSVHCSTASMPWGSASSSARASSARRRRPCVPARPACAGWSNRA